MRKRVRVHEHRWIFHADGGPERVRQSVSLAYVTESSFDPCKDHAKHQYAAGHAMQKAQFSVAFSQCNPKHQLAKQRYDQCN